MENEEVITIHESILQCTPDQLPEYFAREEQRTWKLVGCALQLVQSELKKALMKRLEGYPTLPMEICSRAIDASFKDGLLVMAPVLVDAGVLIMPNLEEAGETDGNDPE